MPTPEERLSEIRHRRLRWNTPLSTEHADRLLEILDLRPGQRLVDLGCGWGELLGRAVARTPGSTGEGVDRSPVDIERARRSASRTDLADRVRFTLGDAAESSLTSERVICIGASHIWGGTAGALAALHHHLLPGGRALFGDGFWIRPPSLQLVEMFGALSPSLADLVDLAVATGFRPLHADTTTASEWDEFEWTSYRNLEEFASESPPDPLAPMARGQADVRRAEYLRGYREVLWFAYLVIERA